MPSTTQGTAALSLFVNVALVALKLSVGLAIGSLGVLSDALDSTMDLAGATIAVAAIRLAARPADRQHPYGHGKAESFSAAAEAALILVAAGLVTGEAVRRLVTGVEVSGVGLGIAAMAVSMAVNAGLAVHLRRVARRTHSIALDATATHRATDILTSAAVFAGLIVVLASGRDWVDPAVAIAVAAFVGSTSFRLARRAVHELMDVRLSDEEEEGVRAVLEAHGAHFVDYHSLRTRRSGPRRYIDLHLTVPQIMTVADAHELTDRLEAEIEARLPDTITTIHVEPCEVLRSECAERCPLAPIPYCHEQRHALEGRHHPRPATGPGPAPAPPGRGPGRQP